MSDDSECTKTTYINLTIQKKELVILPDPEALSW